MRLILVPFLFLVLTIPCPAFALKLTPFKAALVPGQDGGSQVFRIENNSNAPAAVQISVMEWSITPDGREENRDAEDQFVIFPAQLVLKAHESRAVRVQWLGDPAINVERPYRIVAEQIPITLRETPAAETGLMFMIKFMGGLYVGPAGVKPDIETQVDRGTHGTMRVTLNNRGSGHTLLNKPVLILTDAQGHELRIEGPAMDGANVHAGQTRYFDLPAPSGVVFPVQSAHLEYQYGF